jgi:hypothetical protein
MIEVFKTNVRDQEIACMLIDQIHLTFVGYEANFDLEDCDKILRVSFAQGIVHASLVIGLLKHFKYHAEVLKEEVRPAASVLLSNN